MIKFNNKNLIDAIFNDRWTCNVCYKEIFSGYFCDECNKNIEKISENKCLHCGRYTPYSVNYCDSCIEKNINFDIARSVYKYKIPISLLIQNFKYKNKKFHYRFFAGELYKLYKAENLNCDAVCFVPMTEERFSQTGYNHSELLAKEFCRLSNLELLDCIEKVKETERQATLTLTQRRKNLKSAFKTYKKFVNEKHVLLIDDVLTTGATSDAIAKLLKSKGAKSVTVLTVASVSKYDKNQ